MTDLVLRDGRLPGRPGLVDIHLVGGSVAEVAPASSPNPPTAAPAEEVDLDGRWVLPGLWDHHVHVEQWALARARVDVAPARSAAEAAALVADHVRATTPPPGEVVVGTGFRDGLWADHPSAELLEVDGVAVCLISGDAHTVWSNRTATRRLALGDEDWWLREEPAFELTRRLGALADGSVDASVAAVSAAAAARGLVGLVDLEMRDAGAAWTRRIAAGNDRLRVRAGVYPPDLAAAAARGQRTGSTVDGTCGLLTGGPLKVLTDGSLNTRTAWCYDPYPGTHTHDTGLPTYEAADLLALLRQGRAQGLSPTVHAIGDRAVTQALDAFEALGGGGSIEHAQLVAADDLPRFARLGVAASVQPEHAMDDRDVAEHHWSGRTARSFPLRSLLDAGAALLLGSDAPVAPLDPWVSIAAAVTRERDGREPWHPEQRLTVVEALAASTRSTVERNQPADLAVVELDPCSADPALLRTMPVAGTLLGGRWTHRTL